MTGRSIWSTLGIERTRDRTAIRRAYAARLRLVHPEDDAAAFQALRYAYEMALAQAGGGASRPVVVARPPPDIEPAPAPVQLTEVHAVAAAREPERPAKPDPPAAPLRAAPPDPPPRPRLEPPPPSPADLQRQALGNLAWSLGRPDVPPAQLGAQIQAVLDSPAMEQVGVYVRIESQLAALIAQHVPRSDPLIEPALARFGWRSQQNAPPAVETILRRARDLAYLASLRQRGHPLHRSFETLQRKPVPADFLLSLLIPGREGDITRLLNTLASDHPGLLEAMPGDAVEAWVRYFAAPRISAPSVWAALISSLVLAAPLDIALGALGAGESFPRALALSACGSFGFLPLKVFAYDRLARSWTGRWSADAPSWLRLGWAPAALAVMLLAAVLPPGVPSGAVIALLDAAVIGWALLTSGGTEDQGRTPALQPEPAPRKSLLATIWMVLLIAAPANAWVQIAIAGGACAFAWTRRRGTLDTLWRQSIGEGPRLAIGRLSVGLLAVVALTFVFKFAGDVDADTARRPASVDASQAALPSGQQQQIAPAPAPP